jgi:(E)-4-hydroxy-3-methylbut-2-enyl-diphosphate synthase
METKSIKIGNLIIGSGFPVAIQTMWKSPLTEDIQPVLNELKELSEVGADIVRFAVPDIQDASILSNISKKSIIPIVADIHFDYKIAL